MSDTDLFNLTITLKSGATIQMEVEDAEYRQNQLSKSLSWKMPDGWVSRILHVDMDEVAAAVVTRIIRPHV